MAAPVRGWKANSTIVRRTRENLRAQMLPCWLCGQPIRYDQAWPHPESFSVDHALPQSTHPDSAMDPGNCRASHLQCNQTRQASKPRPGLGQTSIQ